jgi:2-keto-3-deoxy-L-rhamnonate aldolase RhmA
VIEAINAFHFPPVGRRSWGGWAGYDIAPLRDRLAYTRWWNENGILGFKIESIKAVLNIRALAKPGINYVDFGPSDLQFDLETRQYPRLRTVQYCRAFLNQELAGSHARVL